MDTAGEPSTDVVIFGAGLAGLTAGYTLSRSGAAVTLIEKDDVVGGLARTVEHQGFRFDLGGHRFLTDIEEVERLVEELLGDDLLRVRRSSKIRLGGKYFEYPWRLLDALSGLGPATTARILADYATERVRGVFRKPLIISLEDWVVNRFGRAMFDIFVREYSEKVWGMGCDRIHMEWAEQRIQGLSFASALKHLLLRSGGRRARTLAREFLYPSRGIGGIAQALTADIERTNTVLTSSPIVGIRHRDGRIVAAEARHGGTVKEFSGACFLSTMPLTRLVGQLQPPPPAHILDAAGRLRYRDLVIVAVMIDRERVSGETWIYFPESSVPFGRLHEPTNWSPAMAPPGKTMLVTERFCFRDDEVWRTADDRLVEDTVISLADLGLIEGHQALGGVVVRVPNAYPVFEVGYEVHYQAILRYLEGFSNLRLAGRGGMFRYFNMDHAMASGLAAAREIIADGHRMPETLP